MGRGNGEGSGIVGPLGMGPRRTDGLTDGGCPCCCHPRQPLEAGEIGVIVEGAKGICSFFHFTLNNLRPPGRLTRDSFRTVGQVSEA